MTNPAGPTKGAIAKTEAGKQVIADEAAAEERLEATEMPQPTGSSPIDPEAMETDKPTVDVGQSAEPMPAVSTATDDPKSFVDPVYQMDHPEWGTAGTRRIWRFPNGLGVVVDRSFRTGALTIQDIEFTGVEVTSYKLVGDPKQLGREEEITPLVRSVAST